jgi:hypothetical protein
MSIIRICDICSRRTYNNVYILREKIGFYEILAYATDPKNFEICENCVEEFKEFIHRKKKGT